MTGKCPYEHPSSPRLLPAGIGTVLLSQGLPRLHRAFPSTALDDVASPIRLSKCIIQGRDDSVKADPLDLLQPAKSPLKL